MTREEAINHGREQLEIFGGTHREFIEMAIKALEQEPTTKNDLGVDCISRADAIKAMQDKAKKLTNEDTINGLCGAVAILFDLPSVTTKNDLGVDCISRADVKAKKIYSHERNEYVVPVAEIDWLPSVTPQESKTGHWIHGEYCSECGCDVPAYIIDWKWQKDMDAKYCPNCGAKMDEPQESEG